MQRMIILAILASALATLGAQQKQRLAIMDFEVRGAAPKYLGETIADMIACRIKPAGFQLIERRHLKQVIKERVIKMDTVMDSRQLQQIGASHLLVGFIDKTEDRYSGGYRLIKVDTAIREEQWHDYVKAVRDYQDFVTQLAKSLEQQRQKILLRQNLISAAGHLVKEIGPWLKQSKLPADTYKIGVFAFGDKNGDATAALGNLPVLMQGELVDQLRAYLGKETPGKYTLFEPDQLKVFFLRAGASPVGINPKTLALAAKTLKKFKLDVGIVGRYSIIAPQNTLSTGVDVEAKAIFSVSQQVLKAQVSVGAKDVQQHGGIAAAKASGRFQLDLFYKPDDRVADADANGWRRLPLYRVKNSKSSYHNGYFVVLKRNMQGKRYKIRLVNYGRPAISATHPLDADRLFAAALLIDGVNSIYQDKGTGRKEPVVLHPLKVVKWVLSAPQREIVRDHRGMLRQIPNNPKVSKIKGGSLRDVSGVGDSVLEIFGFQKNKNFANAFVFARPGDSIAETVGITDSIGMIAAYFYPEKLPGDERGTKAGKEVKSPTFAMSFKIISEPAEVIRVFYRYEDDLPCAGKDLELVKPAN